MTTLARFDRYAVMTFGLDAEGFAPNVSVNGLALVTRFVSGGPWSACMDAVTTVWVAC